MPTKLKIEFVKNEFLKRGYQLLSKEYTDAKTPLDFLCLKHKDAGVQHITWSKFQMGRGCRPCKGFRILNIDIIRKEFKARNYTLISTKYENNHNSLKYICNLHPEIGIKSIQYNNFHNGNGCSKCAKIIISNKFKKTNEQFLFEFNGINNNNLELLSKYINEDKLVKLRCKKCNYNFERTPRVLLRGCVSCPKCSYLGEKSHHWKGGLSPYSSLFRSSIRDVFDNPSLKYFGYKCVLTNENKPTIHHLYGFNKILEETLNDLYIDVKSHCSDYTDEEIILITEKLKENHLKYGLGIPLCTKIHKLFHSIYGKGNNTHLQFAQFMNDLIHNKYDCYLKENKLTLDINPKLIEFMKPYLLEVA